VPFANICLLRVLMPTMDGSVPLIKHATPKRRRDPAAASVSPPSPPQPVGWVEPTGPARSGRPDDRLRETHRLRGLVMPER